jgi:hypothetical protein
MGFLAQLILVLAEVHDLAHRRLRRRRDLDKIVSRIFRFLQRVGRRQNAELLVLRLRANDAYRGDTNLPIDP